MRFPILCVLLVACAPPESAWEITAERCGDVGWGALLDPGLAEPDVDGTFDATFPSVDCIDAILADLHVDAASFDERDVDRLPLGRETFLEPITDADRFAGLAFPLYAARLLLMHDLGRVGDVETDLLVQGQLVKRLRKAGGGRRWGVQEALYQMMVDDIDAIAAADADLQAEVDGKQLDVRSSWNPGLNRLSVYDAGWPGGYASLGAIFHELRHDDGPDHIDARGRSGDVGGTGSYGWEATAQTLVWRGLSSEARDGHDDAMAAWVTNALLRIEQWRADDGELFQPWNGFPWNDGGN